MPIADRLPRYCLADLVVDVGRRSVRRGAADIHLSKLSFDALRALVEAAPNVVSNDELMRTVWNGLVVGPETVTQRIKLLRDALGDNPEQPRYIAGLRGQGYRILPPVTLQSSAPGTSAPEALTAAGRIRSRLAPTVLVTTALTVVVLYVILHQVLPARQGEAPRQSTPNGGVVAFHPPPHSIAVLPFVNISGDKEQEYFSDGLTEEVLNSLAQISELQVAARTSSFAFKDDTDIVAVAHTLNVASVLQGSVRRAGPKVRVTAQLINAITGFHVWSKTYDRDLGDVLKLQTEIATSVAAALKVTLLSDVVAKIELGGTRNPEAFDAYLRASKAFQRRHVGDGIPSAIAAYTEAIRLDPNYALALAGRSYARTTYAAVAWATDAAQYGHYEEAAADARRAVALAPDLAEAQLALAYVLEYGTRDFVQASEAYTRALALAPGNAQILRSCAEFAAYMGHFDVALVAARRAVVLDPLARRSHTILGRVLFTARRYQEAATAFAEAIGLDPSDKQAYGERGLALYALGDFEGARVSCEAGRDDYTASQPCLAMVYYKLGRRADAEAELKKYQDANGDAGTYQYATIYAQWGDRAKALQSLDTAVRVHDGALEYLKTDPLFDPLRQEPRVQAIERGMKFPN